MIGSQYTYIFFFALFAILIGLELWAIYYTLVIDFDWVNIIFIIIMAVGAFFAFVFGVGTYIDRRMI